MAHFRAPLAPPASLQNSAATCGGTGDAVSLLCDAPAAGGVSICAYRVPDGAPKLELRLAQAMTTPDAQAWSTDGGTLAIGVGRELHVYAVCYSSIDRGLRMIWRAALHFHCKALAVLVDSTGITRVAAGGADGVLVFCGPSDYGRMPNPEPESERDPEPNLTDTPCVAAGLSLLHHEPVCCLAFASPGMVAGKCIEVAAGTVDGRLIVCVLEIGCETSDLLNARTHTWPLGEEGGGSLRRVTSLSYRPLAATTSSTTDKQIRGDESRAATSVLAVACWDGTVHLLSAYRFARADARGNASAAEEPVKLLSRWRFSTPRLIRDVETVTAGGGGGDSAAMENGAALLCWSPDGDTLVLALSGELHFLNDEQHPTRAQAGIVSKVDPRDEWGHQFTARDWRLLKPHHGGGDQKLQIKGLTSARSYLVVVSRMPADRHRNAAGLAVLSTGLTRSDENGNSLAAVLETSSTDGCNDAVASDELQLNPAATTAVETRKRAAVGQVSSSFYCVEWSSIMQRRANAGNAVDCGDDDTNSLTCSGERCIKFRAGTVTLISEMTSDAVLGHNTWCGECPAIGISWSDTASESPQHQISLTFAPYGVRVRPYTSTADGPAAQFTQQHDEDNLEKKDSMSDQGGQRDRSADLVARVLLGIWGLVVIFDGSVYVWLRTHGACSWRLVVTPARARDVCVGVGCMPTLPSSASDMEAATHEQRWWWLAVEDDQRSVATLPLLAVSKPLLHGSIDCTAGMEDGALCADGDLHLWERVSPDLQ